MTTDTITQYALLGDTISQSKPLYLPVYEELSKYPGTCFFSNLGLWSLIFAIVVMLLAVGLFCLFDKRYKLIEHTANRNLTAAFLIVWTLGFIVYDVGMYTGEPMSLLGNVPMAIVHAFGTFIFESDVSAIHEPFHNNAWFMAGFSLVHLLAAIISLVFVLKVFGFNLTAAFRRFFARREKKRAYVFWGMNDATYALAKDIIKTENDSQDYRIIVVRTNGDASANSSVNGINRLFNFLSMKNKDLDRLSELNCITIGTYTSLTNIDTISGNTADILNKELRLYALSRILKKIKSDIHIFMLSDDEKANIKGVENLLKDTTIRDISAETNVKFYCHARYNSVHRVIKDENTTQHIDIDVIDSSHISIDLLKNTPSLHPVNYVDIEQDGTVSSPFNAMVVGFGEVGMDAVRFLYEFGAFVKTNKEGESKVQRSAFHCYAFDKDIDNQAGQFVANAPALKLAIDDESRDDDNSCPLHLYNMDCQSVGFYKKIETLIRRLNYIVVATGDDDMNISIGIRLLRLAIRYRKNLKHFRILVRVKRDDNHHILIIARYYNRLCAAEHESATNPVYKDLNRLHQGTIAANEAMDEPITLFGLTEQVYTVRCVIRDALKEEAKQFKFQYDASLYGAKSSDGWEREQNDLLQLDGKYKGYAPTLSGVMKLRRVQSQNINNSLHGATKEQLAKVALGSDYGNILTHGMERPAGSTKYRWKDHADIPMEKYQKVLDTLAETEHLRWNASHEILGYQFSGGTESSKDEARLLHGCLKAWDDLSTETKSKDYDTVDVSLKIKAHCRYSANCVCR